MSASSDNQGTPLAPHGVLKEHYDKADDRERFVQSLFDQSAQDYDRLSRLLSFGTDRWYRRKVMQRLGVCATTRHLDVATGTGLLLRAAMDQGGTRENCIGLDPSFGMLTAHAERDRVPLVQGRGERLPFAPGSFHLVTMGYALRHVADLHQLFSELHRVLRSDGRIAILEITRPQSALLRTFIRFYFATVVPVLLGRAGRRRSRRLMAYYCATIEECLPPETVVQTLGASGFVAIEARRTGPLLTDFLARKPPC